MIVEMILWFFLLEILSFIFLPLTTLMFSNLRDKGYGFSKIISIFFLSFLTWYMSFFIPYNYSLMASIVIFSALNFYISKKTKIVFDKKTVKKVEIIFLLSFMIFTFIRSFTPAVEGLEKLFDISLINGILKSKKMPPRDPWLAGYTINYYYFGHFTVATLTKMSFLPSTVTFNLFLSTIYSLLSVALFTLFYNITGKPKYSYFGIFIFIFLSNLLGFLQILTFLNPKLVEFFGKTFDITYSMTCCHNPYQNFINFLLRFPVWSSTRVIPNTINEFPYANLMFGEVHSHIISLPLQILLISLIFSIFVSKEYKIIYIILASLILSLIYITSSWSVPIYFILLETILLILFFEKKVKKNQLIFSFFVIITFFVLFSLPYIITVKKKVDFGFVKERSNIFQELILFPVFIFSLYYYYLKDEKNPYKIFFLFLVSLVLYLISQIQLVLLLFPLLFLSMKKLVEHKNQTFLHILVCFGICVMLFPEIFFIDSRYNTVFKFYYNIWIFWSISTALIVYELKTDKIFLSILFILILICLPMTIFSLIDRFNQGLSEGFSLDGLMYMKKYRLGDYKLLEWANSNINDDDIILEASGDAYTYSSIFSSYTGFQTLVGWTNHIGIHHNMWPDERIRDIKIIYETNDEKVAKEIIEKYNISYVFFGSVERSKYPNANLTKFGKPVYSFDGYFIFKTK